MTDLHLQYRPKLLKNVIGQSHVTNSIQELFNSGKVPHAFLLVGNSGTGKCVTGDTTILTEGGFSKISEFSSNTLGFSKLETNIQSFSGVEKTSNFFEEETGIVVYIENEIGLNILGTEEHPILIMEDGMVLNFKKLRDLKKGDFSIVHRKTKLFPKNNLDINYIPIIKSGDYNSINLINIPKSFNENLSKILGYFIANGCFYKDNFQMSTKNKILQEDLLSAIKIYGQKFSKIQNKKDFSVGGVHFGRFIKYLLGNPEKTTARYKTVPEFVLKGTESVQIAFLKSLIDSDSWSDSKVFLEYYSSSCILIDKIQLMLLNLGIVSKKRKKYLEEYSHFYYTLCISGKDLDLYKEKIGSLKYTFEVKKRNTNKDIIPFFKKYLRNKIRNIKEELIVDRAGRFSFKNERHIFTIGKLLQNSTREATYEFIKKNIPLVKEWVEKYKRDFDLLDTFEYFNENNFYFSQILEKNYVQGKKLVYDFVVPKSHSFVSNGFISHNTTIARIIADMLNTVDLVEIDAATYTGVDDMRTVAEGLKYRAMYGNGVKFLILDECHQLSKQSWNSWLKFIEEPPEHVYICFCTTEVEKVPLTIQTRCHKYTLQDLSVNNLVGLVEQVSEIEKIALPDKAAFLIAKESYGSARQALVYLSMVRMCSTLEEVQKILRTSEDKPEVIDLCRAIVGSRYYESNAYIKVIQLLSKLKDVNPLSIKIQVMNYLTGCILKSKTENEAVQFLHMLEIFDRPVDQQTGFSSIVLAVSEIFLKK